jgi:GT2 family glycosyltransferase
MIREPGEAGDQNPREMKLPRVDVIMVNRNSGGYLRECLASIAALDCGSFTLAGVHVVDDASTDGSADGLERYDLPIGLVRTSRHTGYGACCNLAARRGNGDYLLFLNTDTTLARDSLTGAVAFMEHPENVRVAIAGIRLIGEFGEVNRDCARFPTVTRYIVRMLALDRMFPRYFLSNLMTEWDHKTTREVDQVIGAYMLMRRAAFEALGGYDEQFFVYMEDLDLSLRAVQHGWRSVYIADTYAYHKGGGTATKVMDESLFFNLRSRIQYGFKHFGFVRGLWLSLATLLVEPVTRLAWALIQRSRADLVATLKAYGRLWHWVGGAALRVLVKTRA